MEMTTGRAPWAVSVDRLGDGDIDERADQQLLVARYRAAERHDDDVRSEVAGIDGLQLPGELPAFARIQAQRWLRLGDQSSGST